MEYIKSHKYQLLLWFFIVAYIGYFSILTISRYKTLYASYFDLGIMHQTVFNTYRAITQKDPGRILELTNPFGPDQIKRMAIHNDILLAPLAFFYFINDSPAALLVIQTVVLALGALAIFKITQIVLTKQKHRDFFAFLFSFVFLLYPPLQRSNLYEFHAVTLATTFLLFMFYFWLVKRYKWSFVFFILSLLTKEQVALTTAFFGIYALYSSSKVEKNITKNKGFRLRSNHKQLFFPLSIITLSVLWFIISLYLIIPYFRGSEHFALGYYGDFGDTPGGVIAGVLQNPLNIVKYVTSKSALQYLWLTFGPLGLLSLLSPLQALIALPELAINLLSKNSNQRLIIYQYTAVLTPFIFISAIFATNKAIDFLKKKINYSKTVLVAALYLTIFSLSFAYFWGSLPYFRMQENHPFKYPQKQAKDVELWSQKLKNENLKISTTGQLSPFFTSRRYFYNFSQYYYLADYIVIRPNEIYNYPEKDQLIPVYEKLVFDRRFIMIEQKNNFQVFKKRGV